MFRKEDSPLDTLIDNNVQKLIDVGLNSDEADVIMTRLEKLHKMRSENKRHRVDANTMATIAANLAGIILIIKHENVNVITSKAMSFIPKLK